MGFLKARRWPEQAVKWLLLVALMGALASGHLLLPKGWGASLAQGPKYYRYLPITLGQAQACKGIPEETYTAIPVDTRMPGSPVPAEEHPDLNLALRGYRENPTAYKGLIEYSGGYDPDAPQLLALFEDQRFPLFVRVYQVHEWDGQWPGQYGTIPITDPEVTLAGLASQPGEKIYIPSRQQDIYQGRYIALVLYAAPERITIKYTRDDNVVYGYTVHIEHICVEPRLLALYRQKAAEGRRELPALERGQAIGRAIGNEVGVAIRDTGAFMDPRSRKDWWQALAPQGIPFIDAADSPWFQAQQERLRQRLPLDH